MLCKNCNNKVPYRVLIDGTWRKLNSRVYCLDCSPFGKHNTREPQYLRIGIIVCSECSREYWYERSNRNGATRKKCNSCVSNARRNAIKEKAVAFLGGKCHYCGYNKCNRSMIFHHLDPSKKEFSISYARSYSWSKIEAELRKCILICSNCHGEVHDIEHI